MKVLLILLLASLAFSLSAQPIYKVVDEEGNVTYTDQKPDDSSEPVELPELNVLDRTEDQAPIEVQSEPAEAGETLNFSITSPQNEDVLNVDSVTVMLDSSIDLPPTTQVVIYLNGIAQPPVQSLAVRYEGIGGGDHNLRAELQTASGRVLAETDPVRFTVSDNPAREPAPE